MNFDDFGQKWKFSFFLWISLPKNSLFSVQKNQKFHFCPKSSKFILTSIALYKILILSCFTIFQPYLTYRTPQKKALGFWTCHSKSVFFGYIQCKLDSGWVITRSSSKNIFFEKFTSCWTFFIFIILHQNEYLRSYRQFKSHQKTWFLAQICPTFLPPG